MKLGCNSISRLYQALAATLFLSLLLGFLFSTSNRVPWTWNIAGEVDWTTLEVASDISALRDKCDATEWIEGLYMKCDYTPGGIGNQIYLHLACIRYAIEAGAGITLPLILLRDETDYSKLDNSEYRKFDYLFDVEFFKAQMQRNCPQMKILDGLSDLDDFATAYVPEPLHPTDLYSERGFIDVHWREFHALLLQWLGYIPSKHRPAVVRIRLWMCEWDVHDSPQAFFATFGRILRFRTDTRDLAKEVMRSLEIEGGSAHLGVHLRTEADVTNLWTSYEVQSKAFLDAAEAHDLNYIYVASGNIEHVNRFRAEAELRNIKVYDKHDLLTAKDLDILNALTWDQQALIDFEVLRHATFFTGISLSSFSCVLAFSRHNDISTDTVFPFPEDRMSKLVGDEVPLFHTGMWPI